ncbi:MAG: 6-phosphogluconolactonase [Acidobacteria bacterium]|nr:6-phosphogluconolactonase [Acidobacteriota bacterium]
MSQPVIEVYSDADEIARQAASLFSGLATRSCQLSGRFTIALSGGSTPRRLFSALATTPYVESIPWKNIFFFWGDERCVAPDHPESNYRMAYQTLLTKVPVPSGNIFRIPAEDHDPHRAAKNYSDAIRDFFAPSPPRFDLVFLGMGADGHTASLFPGTDALRVNDRIAVANYVEKFNAWRITLTAATINDAHYIVFLVTGEDKAEPLKNVIEGDKLPDIYPSQLILPTDGTLHWMVDRAAARLITIRT